MRQIGKRLPSTTSCGCGRKFGWGKDANLLSPPNNCFIGNFLMEWKVKGSISTFAIKSSDCLWTMQHLEGPKKSGHRRDWFTYIVSAAELTANVSQSQFYETLFEDARMPSTAALFTAEEKLLLRRRRWRREGKEAERGWKSQCLGNQVRLGGSTLQLCVGHNSTDSESHNLMSALFPAPLLSISP